MDFYQQLKKKGKIITLPQRITTPSRKWIKGDPLKNIIHYQLLQILWILGISPDKLVKRYNY